MGVEEHRRAAVVEQRREIGGEAAAGFELWKADRRGMALRDEAVGDEALDGRLAGWKHEVERAHLGRIAHLPSTRAVIDVNEAGRARDSVADEREVGGRGDDRIELGEAREVRAVGKNLLFENAEHTRLAQKPDPRGDMQMLMADGEVEPSLLQ